ncbi:IS5 family transposase [Palleronia caenipelagi]|uniref:IS5 family transposase n=1 Tax=Palleronia caenipelagi TaxID=2489174 RepID=UPI003CCC86C0
MSDLLWLTDAQMARLEPFFPKSHGKPRVDDRRVLSGIIFFNRNGLRWRDAPKECGPHKPLFSRWKRWSEKGIFARMMASLAADHGEKTTVMIYDKVGGAIGPSRRPNDLKAHRTTSSFAGEKGGTLDKRGRAIDRTKGGMNTKLHAVGDRLGRPLDKLITAGQVSGYVGARARCSSLPDVEWLSGDRGYDADWFREALEDRGIRACIPGRKQCKRPIRYDKRRSKRRNWIEIMFGRLKDWRRVATRYDRSPTVFLSAIALAALVTGGPISRQTAGTSA